MQTAQVQSRSGAQAGREIASCLDSQDRIRLCLALLAASTRQRGAQLAPQLLAQPHALTAISEGVLAPSPADLAVAARQADALRSLGITAMAACCLPRRFQALPGCPAMLFVRGAAVLLGAPAFAVVGARRAGPAGCTWAEAAAAKEARSGRLIVSGGAAGIDAAAHRGALTSGSPTLAYLGVAADEIYPRAHRALFQRVLAVGGALVSEHPPGTGGLPWMHAARNRLIAAHAQEVLLVEAAQRSGSLSTANWACRLGRPVWVAPVSVGGARAGLDELLRAGRAAVYAPARATSEGVMAASAANKGLGDET